eukprot:999-Heterococcus_DN1.PRE.3
MVYTTEVLDVKQYLFQFLWCELLLFCMQLRFLSYHPTDNRLVIALRTVVAAAMLRVSCSAIIKSGSGLHSTARQLSLELRPGEAVHTRALASVALARAELHL